MAVAMISVVILMGRQSVTTVVAKFMSALAKHDVDTLTNMTYLNGRDKEEVRKKWDFAVNKAGKHYLFLWKITSSKNVDENNASVTLLMMRNARNVSSYEEKFDIPVVKENGEWKVDVSAISRDVFPALPQ